MEAAIPQSTAALREKLMIQLPDRLLYIRGCEDRGLSLYLYVI